MAGGGGAGGGQGEVCVQGGVEGVFGIGLRLDASTNYSTDFWGSGNPKQQLR